VSRDDAPRGRRARGARRGASRGGRDPHAGWPTGEHSPITPAGEYEQLGKLISGLARQQGWRLVTARIAAVLILLIIAAVLTAGLVAGVLHH
jgi:hypothetical protein